MVIVFLPHPNFEWTAKVLCTRRIAKQRVECHQIITAIEALLAAKSSAASASDCAPKKKIGWGDHPSTRSWMNNLDALKLYFNVIVREWVSRGGVNNYPLYENVPADAELPYWIDCPAVHYSHLAQLIQKESSHYNVDNLRGKVPPEMLRYIEDMPAEYKSYGYIWPYKHTREELLTLPLAQIAEPYADRPICRGAYKDGKVCRNKAIIQALYCRLHVPADLPPPVLCAACYKSGDSCRNKAKHNGYCGVHKKQAPSS